MLLRTVFLGLTLAQSALAFNWQPVFPQGLPDAFLSGASDGEKMVLGGTEGRIWITTDGVTFRETISEARLDVRALEYSGDGQWVALTRQFGNFANSDEADGTVLVSHDAEAWGQMVLPGPSNQRALTFGPEGWLLGGGAFQFIQVGSPLNDATVLYQTRNFGDLNEVLISPQTQSFQSPQAVAYGGGNYFLFTFGGVFQSTDGRNFTLVTDTVGVSGAAATAYHDGRWVVVSEFDTVVSTNDGATWQSISLPGIESFFSGGSDVTWVPEAGAFVYVGRGGVVLQSNGLNVTQWAVVRTGDNDHAGLNVLLPFGEHLYAFGNEGVVERAPKTDPSQWTLLRGRTDIVSNGEGLQFDGTHFWVPLGTDNSADVYRSADGINWELFDQTNDFWRDDLVAGNGIAIFNDNNSRILRSTGSGFQQIELERPAGFNSLNVRGFANGLFFANASENGFNDNNDDDEGIFTSPDGITWTYTGQVPVRFGRGSEGDIAQVAYLDGTYVIVMTQGYIIRSTDLRSWQIVEQSSFSGSAVAAGNGTFVAAVGGNVLSSSNGSLWFSTSAPEFSVDSLGFTDGHFYGLGQHATFVSADGSNWDGVYHFGGRRLEELAVGNGVLTAFDSNRWRRILAAPANGLPEPLYEVFPRVITDFMFDEHPAVVVMRNAPTATVDLALTEPGQSPIGVSFQPGQNVPEANGLLIPSVSGDTDRVLSLSTAAVGSPGPANQITVRAKVPDPGATTTFEAYQTANFTSQQIADGTADPDADPDNDGWPTLLEAFFRMNALVYDPQNAPTLTVAPHPHLPGASQAVIDFDYADRALAVDVIPEASLDLETFFPLIEVDFEQTAVPNEDNVIRGQFRSAPFLAADRPLMFRVRGEIIDLFNGFGDTEGFTGFEDFSSGTLDPAKWDGGDFTILSQDADTEFALRNGRVELTAEDIFGDEQAFGGVLWKEPLPLDRTWQVQMDYDLATGIDEDGDYSARIILLTELEESGVRAELSVFQGSQDRSIDFDLSAGGDDTDFTTGFGGIAATGTLRLTWFADTESFKAEYRNAGSDNFSELPVTGNSFQPGDTEVRAFFALDAEGDGIDNYLALDNVSVLVLPIEP